MVTNFSLVNERSIKKTHCFDSSFSHVHSILQYSNSGAYRSVRSPPSSRTRNNQSKRAMDIFYRDRTNLATDTNNFKDSSFNDCLVGVFHRERRAPIIIFVIGMGLFLTGYFSSDYGKLILFGGYPYVTNNERFGKLKKTGLITGVILVLFGGLWYLSVKYNIVDKQYKWCYQ